MALSDLARRSPYLQIEAAGDPPERYVVTFHLKGLAKLPGTHFPSVTGIHRMEIYLHADYPRLPPRLTWLTEIFHPNILPPRKNGGVCIGGWTPAETLAGLCGRIAEMIQYQNYNARDPLDEEAAVWAKANYWDLPVGNLSLTPDEDQDVQIA